MHERWFSVIYSLVLNWIWVWEVLPSKLNRFLRRTRQTELILLFISSIVWRAASESHGTGQRSPTGPSALLSHKHKHAHAQIRRCSHWRRRPRRRGSYGCCFTPAESLHRPDDGHKTSCHKNWFEAKEIKWRHTPK